MACLLSVSHCRTETSRTTSASFRGLTDRTLCWSAHGTARPDGVPEEAWRPTALEEDMADDDATARRTTKATAAKGARKATVKRSSAAGAPAQPAATKKAGARKAVAGTPATRKAAAAPVTRKAAPAKKAVTANKAVTTKKASTTKKAGTARKAPPAPNAGAIVAPRKKEPPPLRLAAEQTFDDDWDEPTAEPVREDPQARIRAVLRAAAMSLEAGDAPAAQAPAPPRPSPAPPAPDEPVTRVLVSPAPVDDEDLHEELETEYEDEDEDEDAAWAPPEVLDDDTVVIASAPSPTTTTPDPAPTTELPEPTPPARPPLPPTGVISAPTPAAAPAPEKKPRRGPRRLILAILLIAIVAVAAIVAYSLLRDEGVDYSKLKVGDCFDSSSSNEVRGIKVEPCSEPHNSEIFFLVTHPAGPDEPYPGKDVLVQFAADACLGQPLTDYLGIPLEQSKLKDFEIVPQESAWEKGRRVLVCGIDTGGEGDITGSVKGTRR